ncbi:MAG: rod shape-determining protein [Geminicoccales bacterium]
MLSAMRGFFTQDLAIDLGTANTLVYCAGRGIVFNEPTVIALRDGRDRRSVIALGRDAKAMLGKTPAGVHAICPLSDGVVTDFEVAEELIKLVISKALNRRGPVNARIVVTVPSGATPVERRAIREAAERAGARRVYLIDEPIAAAIGAELPVTEPRASMVVDIGGGTTEVAVMSLGGIVSSQCIRVGGNAMDAAIASYLRRRYNLHIGGRSAEAIKLTVGAACQSSNGEERRMMVKGRDLVAGIPRTQEIHESEVIACLAEPIGAIVDAVKTTLEQTVPELSADMVENGMVLTGGGGLLRNLDVVLEHATGLPTTLAREPLTCGALGAGLALERVGKLERFLVH